MLPYPIPRAVYVAYIVENLIALFYTKTAMFLQLAKPIEGT